MASTEITVTNAPDKCIYTSVTAQQMFHEYLLEVLHFYFPLVTAVTLICQDDMSRIKAQGHYTAPDFGEVHTHTLSILPTRHYHHHHHPTSSSYISHRLIKQKYQLHKLKDCHKEPEYVIFGGPVKLPFHGSFFHSYVLYLSRPVLLATFLVSIFHYYLQTYNSLLSLRGFFITTKKF